MHIKLPYPVKALWPNGRAHYHAKARATDNHRAWAHGVALAVKGRGNLPDTTGWDILLTVYPKPTGPFPDKDNASAACKAYLDGIADALGVNDRLFSAPRVQFAERCKEGKFVFTLTEMVAL